MRKREEDEDGIDTTGELPVTPLAPSGISESAIVELEVKAPRKSRLEKKPDTFVLFTSKSKQTVITVNNSWRPRMNLPSGTNVYKVQIGDLKEFEAHYLIQTGVIGRATPEDSKEIESFRTSLEDARKAQGVQ